MKKLVMSMAIMGSILIGTTTTSFAYTDGMESSSSGLTQASSRITYKSKPAVYNSSFSCAYSALGNNAMGYPIAQVGYAVENKAPFNGGCLYFFGWINSDQVYHELYTSGSTGTGPAIGSSHVYKVTYSAGSYNGTAYGYIDGSRYFSQTINWVPDVAVFAGEIYDTQAAYPGKSSNREVFSEVSVVKNGSTVVPTPTKWWTESSAGLSNSGYSSSNNTFQIWDTRY